VAQKPDQDHPKPPKPSGTSQGTGGFKFAPPPKPAPPAAATQPDPVPTSNPSGAEFPRSFNPLLLAKKLEELDRKSSTATRKLQPDDATGSGVYHRKTGPQVHGLPPDPEDVAAKALANLPANRDERIACSFPGVMKILVPEKSFLPFPVAVRVANLSVGGALVEVHDKTKLEYDIALPNRFFELKVAHPDVPLLRGTIAWSDMSRANPLLGLSTFERHPELADIAVSTDSPYRLDGPPPLPTPTIDPFPPVVREEMIVISGVAPEAMEISVKRNDLKFDTKVKRGRFELKLELEPNAENHFTLRAIAGERRSRPVPIRIDCEKKADEKRFRFNASMGTDKNGAHQVKLEFNGSMRQAELVLYRFSQLMAISETVNMQAVLESREPFDRRLYDALRSEGAVLSADTGRNEAASKLLEELL